MQGQKRKYPRFSPSVNPTIFTFVRVNNKTDILFIYQGRFNRWIVVNPLNGVRYFEVEHLIDRKLNITNRNNIHDGTNNADDNMFCECINGFCIIGMEKKKKKNDATSPTKEMEKEGDQVMLTKEFFDADSGGNNNEDEMVEMVVVCITNKKLYQFTIGI